MILSIINQKGGVAKTTTVYNVAHMLAGKGKKVLQVDIDPQASLTSANGFNPESIDKNIYNVMCEKEDIKNCIYEVKENLYLLPSSIDLSVAETKLLNEMARESILKKSLDTIKNNFDYILIDCPPTLSILTINALCSSSKALIPVATEFLSFRGLELLLETIYKVKENLNDEIEILGLIATRFNTVTNHSKDVLEILEEKYNVIGKINNSVALQDSIAENKSISEYDPKHQTAKQYFKIAEEIIKENENEKK